jgi:cbb3-type cytochrome oxidase subunit 3
MFAEGAPRSKPRSLIAAISEIQELAIVEKMGRVLPEHVMLVDRSFSYTEVGIHGVLMDMLINLIGIPLSLAVVWGFLPIFSSEKATWVDRILSMVMGVGYGIGFSIMIGRTLGPCYYGKVCRRAINHIYHAMIWCHAIKILLLFMVFHYLRTLISPDSVHAFFNRLWPAFRPFMPPESAVVVQDWMMHMREVMILSSWWALAITMISLCIPYVYFQIGAKKAAEEHRRNVLYDAY